MAQKDDSQYSLPDKMACIKEQPDTPQFCGGNPYFFSENPYQSVSFIYASMYRENVHAIHITMQFLHTKIATLCNKGYFRPTSRARQSD